MMTGSADSTRNVLAEIAPEVVTMELSVAKSRWDAIQQGQRVALDDRQRLGLGVAPVGDLIEVTRLPVVSSLCRCHAG